MATRTRRIGHAVPFVLLSGFVLASAAGCGLNYGSYTEDTTEKVALTEIQLTGGSGGLTVIGDATGETRIHRKVRYWGRGQDRPEAAAYQINGGVLSLNTRCGKNCSIDYEIHAPANIKVTAQSGSSDIDLSKISTVDVTIGSGDVQVAQTTGNVNVRTNSGEIKLSDLVADVTARSSSGDIDATNLHTSSVDVLATSGDVTLTLAAPGSVIAKAESGDVTVTVPAGSYKVAADAGSGDVNVKVPNDANAANSITAHANSGTVTVRSS